MKAEEMEQIKTQKGDAKNGSHSVPIQPVVMLPAFTIP